MNGTNKAIAPRAAFAPVPRPASPVIEEEDAASWKEVDEGTL